MSENGVETNTPAAVVANEAVGGASTSSENGRGGGSFKKPSSVSSTDTAVVETGDKDKCADVHKATVSIGTPLLIEEIHGDNLPESYTHLLDEMRTWSDAPTALSKADTIVAFAYIIMLEEGFVPIGVEYAAPLTEYSKQQVLTLSKCLPRTWKRSGSLYEISFVVGAFAQFVCRLVCTTSTDDLIINCKVYGVSGGNYSIIVDPALYVVESTTALRKRYQNVRQFATQFKDRIAYPAKVDVLHANAVRAPTLQDLPAELVHELAKIVDVDLYQCL